MSIFSWPPSVLPQSIAWRYLSASRSAISPFDGDLTVLARVGDRWSGECSFARIFDDEAAEFETFLARLHHQEHQFILPPHFYKRRGSHVPVNLAPNGGTFDVIGPWTAFSSFVTIETGMLRVRNSAAANGVARSGAIAVTANTQYVLRVECLPGSTDLATSFEIFVGTSAGASNLVNSGARPKGIYTTTFNTGANTSIHIDLICNTTTTGDFVYFDNLVIERCGLLQGAHPPGDLVLVDGLTVSQTELLKKADMIEINGQLLKLLNGLSTDNTGLGIVRVSPSLRGTIPDNTPVIIGTPMGRFVMRDDPTTWNTVGYFEKAFTMSFLEDITT